MIRSINSPHARGDVLSSGILAPFLLVILPTRVFLVLHVHMNTDKRFEVFMELENPNSVVPKTTAELLSAGRREFINRESYDGPHMIAIASLFDAIAQALHGTRFQWSDYNRSEWDKFVSLSNSNGGACAFSLEPRGDYDVLYEPFKGLFVGGPVGLYPYYVGPLVKAEYEETIDRITSKAGFHRSH
jgi:hypothetical protein